MGGILLGGHRTNTILLEQGVPKGDIISPFIFIIAGEILLIKINKSKRIKGVQMAGKECSEQTFANDTTPTILTLFGLAGADLATPLCVIELAS